MRLGSWREIHSKYANFAKWMGGNVALLLTLTFMIPLIHRWTFHEIEKRGMGFDVLIYEPFPGAAFMVVSLVFLSVNMIWAYQKLLWFFGAVICSLVLTLIWFYFAFGFLVETHLQLGGAL